MTASLERFLGAKPAITLHAALGRVFNVTRETWRLTDDPKRIAPRTELILAAHTASEAADLARDAAAQFPRSGFHKPSGAWWGADAEDFHRFVVHPGRRRRSGGVLAALALTAVAALGVARLSRRRDPPRAG